MRFAILAALAVALTASTVDAGMFSRWRARREERRSEALEAPHKSAATQKTAAVQKKEATQKSLAAQKGDSCQNGECPPRRGLFGWRRR